MHFRYLKIYSDYFLEHIIKVQKHLTLHDYAEDQKMCFEIFFEKITEIVFCVLFLFTKKRGGL